MRTYVDDLPRLVGPDRLVRELRADPRITGESISLLVPRRPPATGVLVVADIPSRGTVIGSARQMTLRARHAAKQSGQDPPVRALVIVRSQIDDGQSPIPHRLAAMTLIQCVQSHFLTVIDGLLVGETDWLSYVCHDRTCRACPGVGVAHLDPLSHLRQATVRPASPHR